MHLITLILLDYKVKDHIFYFISTGIPSNFKYFYSCYNYYMKYLIFICMNLILVQFMCFEFTSNSLAQENNEVEIFEEVEQNSEPPESPSGINLEGQNKLQIPRDVGNSAPDSISQGIQEAEEIKKAIFKFDPFNIFIQPWKNLNKKISEAVRLEFTIAYTALYQVATKATQGDQRNQASGGIFDFSGLWEIISEKSKYSAYVGFRGSSKHKLFTDITPSELALNIGSLWRTDGHFGMNEFFISQLWWEQNLLENEIIFRVGKLDQADYIDSFNFSSSKLYFINSAFSDNPTIFFPGNGLGAAAVYQPNDFFYLLASIGDANGNSTTFEFDSFFSELEFFTGVEIGIRPTIDGFGKGNYHVALWHSDRIKKKNIPSGNGVAITFQQQIWNYYNTFLRYSYSNGKVTNIKQLLSAGVGIYDPFNMGYNDNLFGLAFAWGEPQEQNQNPQYVIESFLRLQVFDSVQVTPDIQLIISPSEATQENFVAVFGMRFRIAF